VKLLVIARPFVFHGGVERATAGLLGGLVAHGYEVHLLSPPGQAEVPGVRLHRLPLPPLPAVPRMLALAAMARLVVGRGDWDIVQSHERTLRQDVYRAGEGCHRAYLASRGTARGRGLYHRVVLALERRVLEGTPRIAAIARMGQEEIRRLYGVDERRVSVVYNGIDLERFHPRNRARDGGAARLEAGIPRDAWVLLFVGSGFQRKGLDYVVEALARLPDRRVRLLVVGKGNPEAYRQRAERLGVGARIVWLGPRADVERWYAAADVLVLPTRYEPFGNVHLEALASGVPVVSSVHAGGSEIVQSGINGVVIDPEQGDALAGAVERLRDVAGDGLVDAARRSAEPFTYAAQVAGFTRIYQGLP
jgi:UDP-glucose:(heptosyl)LPS alpha-1,3-glucosyltransferase